MDENSSNNTIRLCGTLFDTPQLSHEVHGQRIYSSKIEVLRTSGTADVIRLLINEKLLGGFTSGDMVSLTGQFRSYNSQGAEHGGRVLLNVFVQSIESAEQNDYVNEAELDGYICKPVSLRRTPLGRDIADVMLAVNRSFHKSDYIPCIFWGRNAAAAGEMCVGTHLHIVGRIQSRTYKKLVKTGEQNFTAYEVSVSGYEIIPQA